MSVVACDPNIQGGEPCFRGTRVPVKNLFDYLVGGETIDEFLTQFPSVERNQVTEFFTELENTFKPTKPEGRP